ncbi:MAG: hypothetical protein AMS21_12765 [Gemmatimonas sp. SG8_38_2]|nr:MAG: hypothetical protein AMS21_12765 [Gemmatimonas sp. SG8_38_2]
MRRSWLPSVLSLVAVGLFGCGDDAQGPGPGDRLEALESCNIPGVARARCGSFSVYEDREARAGRTIDIAVLVLLADDPEPEPDPVLFISGGPGQSSTDLVVFSDAAYSELRRDRDLVFIDQRGTGLSSALICQGPLPGGEASVLGTLFPPDHIDACRRRLATRADLGLYATHLAVDDMAEVLTEIGYEQVNLIGTSFGTRVIQVFLRQHPNRVRTAVLNGVVPVNRNTYLYGAPAAQAALDMLIEECESDPACSDRYPDARSRFWDLVARFDDGPIQVDRPRGTVLFDRGDFGYAVRGMLYGELADQILLWTWDTYLIGDFTRFADYAIERSAWVASPTFATGLHLSVVCAEDIPFTTDGEVESLTAGTFLGPHLIERYRSACQRWPQGSIPAGYREPVTSSVPVLVISGERDPATPAAWGDEVAARLPNSRHIIVPRGGHAVVGPCTLEMQVRLILEGSVAGLGSSCPVGG